ncbi:MAG: hypothetical protein LBL39_05910 [Planctomycetaceae bacterium]|nr:hypothetical protein [Planctomycetaceae bacterium]
MKLSTISILHGNCIAIRELAGVHAANFVQVVLEPEWNQPTCCFSI